MSKAVANVIKQWLQENFDSSAATYLRETHGIRARKATATLKREGDYYELATTYFYRNQARTLTRMSELKSYLEQEGFKVRFVDYAGYTEPEPALFWREAPWPKESWCITYFEVIK